MRKEISRFTIAYAAIFAAQLAAIPAHAAVSSDEDSVSEWGSWATLATAAGGNAPTLNLNFQFTNPQNFIDSAPFVTPVDPGEEPGPLFFGALSDAPTSSLRDLTTTDLILAGNRYGGNDRLMTSLTSTITLSSDNPELDILGTGSFTVNDEYGNSLTSVPLQFIEGVIPDLGTLLAAADSESADAAFILSNSNLFGIKVAGLNAGFIRIVNGGTASKGTFIGGTPTAGNLDAIQALAGDTVANYSGTFLRSPFRGNVSIDVNFTTASWNGNFSNGQNISFEVNNGLINAANLTATTANISAPEATVNSGSVAASFFGDNAEAIAGIADIDIEGQDRFVDTFATLKGSPAQ